MAALYPKRLIEVDLPIKRISAHARREKSIRHGHISTLHIWWARRPLAACRAVICAALWLDPADPLCPEAFREVARTQMLRWATQHRQLLSAESFKRFNALAKDPNRLNDPRELRLALLDFIADFANWDNSTSKEYLETSRTLTQAAYEAVGGEPGTKPLVVDPFAGGGAIPLEALRVGADAFASDLNPVAVLLNKVVLEYIPKYGQQLADEARKWGQWVQEQAEKELAEFYPKDSDGASPIAYLWARTIHCEGPGCGVEVPLIRSFWLAKRRVGSVALKLVPSLETKSINFDIIYPAKPKDVGEGTVRKGAATCPVCGYTTPVARVRQQLKSRQGGAYDARLFAVVMIRPGQLGRFYRLPNEHDLAVLEKVSQELENRKANKNNPLPLIPEESLDIRGIRHTWAMIYGLKQWANYFTPRQMLALITLVRLVREASREIASKFEGDLATAIQTCLALNIDKLADLANSLCPWEPVAECPRHLFARQAIPLAWDFGEGVVIGQSSGSWAVLLERFTRILAEIGSDWKTASPQQAPAAISPLPDEAAHAFITDPPYYDAVPYAYLSDFFFVWLRRCLFDVHPDLFKDSQVPKDEEIVVDRPHELSNSTKDIAFYERELAKAFAEGRRILRPAGIGTIVFASKTTASWEAILKAVVDAGWVVTGSWPIDTEMETRVAAQGQARLASSIHLVCRPREKKITQEIGDWRDVLDELPPRITEWMSRLVAEGVVGADAIFACLGPAIEIFSRYSHVEKASGERVTLREYLEYVWAAVSREALGMILDGADSSQFEEDARLTAIWFWVLRSAQNGNLDTQGVTLDGEDQEADEEADQPSLNETTASGTKALGYLMEYDAARKLAQGLGADLQKLSRPGGIITIKGNIAALHNVAYRENYLIGWQPSLFDGELPAARGHHRRMQQDPKVIMHPLSVRQRTLFPDLSRAKGDPQQPALPFPDQAVEARTLIDRLIGGGSTVLDRLHQAMLLFGRSQLALLGPFLLDSGMGKDARFWLLAQALSALYPVGSDEKRWVDGVLARKKSLGL